MRILKIVENKHNQKHVYNIGIIKSNIVKCVCVYRMSIDAAVDKLLELEAFLLYKFELLFFYKRKREREKIKHKMSIYKTHVTVLYT
jgi:hypothetical protein